MTLANRIAKKIRRRFRLKGMRIRPTSGLTVAELLITSWYGIPIPKQVGLSDAANRQYERLIAHRDQWNSTPKATTVSRQVRRRQEMARA